MSDATQPPTHLRIHGAATERTLPVATQDAALTLADFLARHNLPLNTRCGGRALCNGCQVQLGRDAANVEKACRLTVADALARSAARAGTRARAAEITIPPRSLLRQRPSVVDDFRVNIPMARDPLAPRAHTRYGAAVDVGTTTVALLLCDLETGAILSRATAFNAQIRHGEDVLTRIEKCRADASAVRELQTAIAAETIRPLLAEACARARLAPADIGVMTVAGNTTMLHLLAGENPRTLGVHPFTPVFLDHRACAPRDMGLDFGPGSTAAPTRNSEPETGNCGGSAAAVHLLPGLSAYVGADLTAGLIATGMAYDDGPALLVDVGTNGEIVAKLGARLIGCATAAGPAFEGAGLTCGTRAVHGAVERIKLVSGSVEAGNDAPATGSAGVPPADGAKRRPKTIRTKPAGKMPALPAAGAPPHPPFLSIELGLIGATATSAASALPAGICGSGYIDFLHEARRAGLLLENGRFAPSARVETDTSGRGRTFCLSPRGASGPLWISEMDIVKLLQAKAAIAAGITTLLDVLGLRPRDIKRLYLAGGFGMHLSLDHAIGCGLLPGFTPGQIQVVGNASLAGAYLALNDRALLDEMRAQCARFEAVELNLHPGFEDAYIDNLALP